MELAPTNSGNILNALYSTKTDKRGNTRDSGQHNGIDFAARVGTPVFSMYDGTITKVVSCQPDGNPKGFSNDIPDKNPAGNRIEVKSTINGQTYFLGYWHLQAGNAVAVNPRTQQPFKVNDFVYRGEILGYSGRTGNAHDVNNPHLHLNMKDSNGNRVDPAPFVNGTITFDVENKKTSIDSIICN